MRGETVILYEKVKTGVDDFGADVFVEVPVQVEDVLIGEPSTDDLTTSTAMWGKVCRCVLGLPKGDRHAWEDSRVDWTDARGTVHKLRTYGYVIMGVEANVPTRWHGKVRCEEYGG